MTTITIEVPDVIEYTPEPGYKTKPGATYRVNTAAWAKPEQTARERFDMGVTTALGNCAALSKDQIAAHIKKNPNFDVAEYVHQRRLSVIENWAAGEVSRERLSPEERMRRTVAVEMLRASADAKGKKLPAEQSAEFTALRNAVYAKYSAKIDAIAAERLASAELVVELDDDMFEEAAA